MLPGCFPFLPNPCFHFLADIRLTEMMRKKQEIILIKETMSQEDWARDRDGGHCNQNTWDRIRDGLCSHSICSARETMLWIREKRVLEQELRIDRSSKTPISQLVPPWLSGDSLVSLNRFEDFMLSAKKALFLNRSRICALSISLHMES